MKKIVHLAGAGKVGQTLALCLQNQPHWQLSHIVSSRLETGAFGAEIVRRISDLPPADVVVLAVPDNALELCAAELAEWPHLRAGTVVLHLSGAKTTAALAAATERGAAEACLHPVFAFADPQEAAAKLSGHLCALDADTPEAWVVVKDLADTLGLIGFAVPAAAKARYHAALSAASNFSVALAAYAQNLLAPLNLPEDLTRQLVGGLMRQSLDNLHHLPPDQALTGPIVRGDDATVAAHLAALNAHEAQVYRAFAHQTLNVAQTRLTADAAARVAAVLAEDAPTQV